MHTSLGWFMEISLVMGSYNPNKEWLDKAIKSAQGLFDEIILVDDHSDIPINVNVNKILRHDENMGFAQARNTGIEHASGDIIASLDDDDYFDREIVIELKEFVKQNPSDIWHFPTMQFGNKEGIWGDNPDTSNMFNHDTIPSSSWFTKKTWLDVGGYGKCKAEDWEFWCKCKTLNKKFTYFNKPVYYHRMRDNSLSSKFTPEMNHKFRKEIDLSCDLLRK